MKKLFLILVMTAFATATMAQSQLSTVRGKTKDGKTIKVEYYQGSVEDYIESVKYQLVDELQAQTKDLQSQVTKKESEIKTLNGQVKDLQGKLNTANAQIEKLKKQGQEGSPNNSQTTELQNQLAQKAKEVQTLNASIVTLNERITNLETERKSLSDANAELEQGRRSLLATIENLQKGNGNTNLIDTIAKRDNMIKSLETEIRQKEAQYASSNAQLNQQIREYERQIAVIQSDVKGLSKPLPTAVISLSAGIGPVFVSNAKLGEVWSKDVATAKYFNLSYATARLAKNFPISIEAGLGIESYKMAAHINACQMSFEKQVDADGDAYTAIFDLGNISEKASFTYLNIPISICIGQPAKDRVTAYLKLGLTPSINLGKKFEGKGTYSLKGYYPQWDVTLEDVEPLGFGENKEFYKDAELNPSKFVLVGHAAFGTYVPLSTKLLLKAGLKCEYTFMQVAPESNGTLPFAIGQCNVAAGAKMFVPSLEIGLVYTLK